jgi:hypothetical protein
MTEQELTERLERLERENRRLKRAGIATLLGLLSIGLLAAAGQRDQSKVIEAQQIIVRDSSGSRAILDGEGLSLYDAKGRQRVELKESKTGPKGMEVFSGDWLKLYDSEGRPGVELTEEVPPADFLQGFTKVQTSGSLVMLDYEGTSVSAANLGVGKATGLWLTKTHLKSDAWPEHDDTDAALLIDGGSAGVQVEEHGNSRIGLFAARGMPGLDLTDAAGYETQVGVADLKYPTTGDVRRTSAASIVMLGEKHHVVWQAP